MIALIVAIRKLIDVIECHSNSFQLWNKRKWTKNVLARTVTKVSAGTGQRCQWAAIYRVRRTAMKSLLLRTVKFCGRGHRHKTLTSTTGNTMHRAAGPGACKVAANNTWYIRRGGARSVRHLMTTVDVCSL